MRHERESDFFSVFGHVFPLTNTRAAEHVCSPHVSPDKLQSKWSTSAAPPKLTNMHTHHNTGQQPWDPPGMHLLSQALLGENRHHTPFKSMFMAQDEKELRLLWERETEGSVSCIDLPSAIPPKPFSCASISCSKHIPMFPFSMFLISGRSRQSVGANIASMPFSSSLRLTAKLVKLYI